MQKNCGQVRFPSCRWEKVNVNTPSVPEWRNGRRSGFKIRRPNGRAGSSPALGTNKINDLVTFRIFVKQNIFNVPVFVSFVRCHFVPIKRLFSRLSRLSPAYIRSRIPSIFSICCYVAKQNEPLVLMVHQVLAK